MPDDHEHVTTDEGTSYCPLAEDLGTSNKILRRDNMRLREEASRLRTLSSTRAERVEQLEHEVTQLAAAVRTHREGIVGRTPPDHWRDCATCEEADRGLWALVSDDMEDDR